MKVFSQLIDNMSDLSVAGHEAHLLRATRLRDSNVRWKWDGRRGFIVVMDFKVCLELILHFFNVIQSLTSEKCIGSVASIMDSPLASCVRACLCLGHVYASPSSTLRKHPNLLLDVEI